MVLFWHLSENNFHVVRRVFKFLFKIYNFTVLFDFKSLFFFDVNNVQAGLINHICFFSICSMYILITPAVEQMLYGRYLFWQQMGELGPYEALTPTKKMMIWLRRLWGGGLVGE